MPKTTAVSTRRIILKDMGMHIDRRQTRLERFVTVRKTSVTAAALLVPSRHIDRVAAVSRLALCDPNLHYPSSIRRNARELPLNSCPDCHYFITDMSISNEFHLEDDAAVRRMLYLAGFNFILVPYFLALVTIWPFGFGNVQWRFGVATTLVGYLFVMPFVGHVMIFAIARAVGDKIMARAIGVFAALEALVLLIATPLFGLDSLQLRSIVKSAEMEGFNRRVLQTGVLLLTFLVFFAVIAVAALRRPKGAPKTIAKSSKKNADDASVGILIGQDYTNK